MHGAHNLKISKIITTVFPLVTLCNLDGGTCCFCLSVESDSVANRLQTNTLIQQLSFLLPVVLYGCETWSHTPRKKGWQYSRIRRWKRNLGLRATREQGSGQTYTRRSIISPILTKNSCGQIKKNGMDEVCVGGERCIQGFGGKTWGKETTCKI